jgi:hypothetical protein
MTESSNRAEAKRAGQAVEEGGRDTLASLLSAFAAVLRTFPDLVLDEDMRYGFPQRRYQMQPDSTRFSQIPDFLKPDWL